MPAVTLSEVSIAFGDRTILNAVTFTVPKGAKIALYGANGSGKSTLMRVMAAEIRPDSGAVHCERQTRISYLPQSGTGQGLCPSSGLDLQATLYQEVEKAFEPQRRLAEKLVHIEDELGRIESESTEALRLLQRHQELQERLEASAYHRRRERIERVLTGLGFSRQEFAQPVAKFSQGWQMRIGLARILCEQADILLLDEPTNYLDLEARTWLEQYLSECPAGVLVVSHDRYFLETTVACVAELYQGRLILYPGSFSRYEERRAQELQQIAAAYERQQEEIARMEAFIRRFRYNASKARLVQSRIGQLERLVRIEPPPVQKHVHISFPDPPHSGKLSLRLEGLGKAYGEKVLFRGLNLDLLRGEKLVLVGPNGAGKSTLMRIMAAQEPSSEGAVACGSGLSLAYYSPDHPEELSGPESVIDMVESWAPSALIPSLRGLLGAFLFRGDDIFKPVAVLSGGERSRLALLRLLLHPANLLFLDEPTNHLDLLSKDVLLQALSRFPGTLVFVSHDRHFIEKLATTVLEINAGRAWVYPGDYSYYLWRKQREQAGQVPAAETADSVATAGAVEERPSPSAGQQTRLAAKRQKSDLKRLAREEAEILAQLERLHGERNALEHSLADERVYRDGAQVKRVKAELEENGGRQEELTRRWEQVDRRRRALQ